MNFYDRYLLAKQSARSPPLQYCKEKEKQLGNAITNHKNDSQIKK